MLPGGTGDHEKIKSRKYDGKKLASKRYKKTPHHGNECHSGGIGNPKRNER